MRRIVVRHSSSLYIFKFMHIYPYTHPDSLLLMMILKTSLMYEVLLISNITELLHSDLSVPHYLADAKYG